MRRKTASSLLGNNIVAGNPCVYDEKVAVVAFPRV